MMEAKQMKTYLLPLLKKWWCSLLLLPFIMYSLHQAYWTLQYNIFFSISYDLPFPVNIINLFVDNFLLIVHEAGHTFASILGWRIFTILGGSLFQLFIPLLILAYFWYNNKKAGMQLSVYLVGFSLMDISFYAADAQLRQLPLLGNLPKEAHDWHNILSSWNTLESSASVAFGIAFLGGLCYIISLVIPAFYRHYEKADIELDL